MPVQCPRLPLLLAKPDKAADGYSVATLEALWQHGTTTQYGLGMLQPLLKSIPAPFSFHLLVLVSTVIFLEKGSVRGQKCCWNLIRAPWGRAGQLPGLWVLERNQTTSLSPCLLWKARRQAWLRRPNARQARAELSLAYKSLFPTERAMKRLDKKAEPLALVHHCMAFKAVPVTTAGAHPEVVTGPVALAWDCFSGLTILSPGKFFEKLKSQVSFQFFYSDNKIHALCRKFSQWKVPKGKCQ